MLNIIDEFTRESLATHVRRKLNSQDVLHVLAILRERISSENIGSELVLR